MMPHAAGRWRTLEHTADLAIEVEAGTPAALFITAARALVGLLRGREEGGGDDAGRGAERAGPGAGSGRSMRSGRAGASAGPRAWRDLDMEAPDRADLLVAWLRELLWIQTSEDVAFVTAEFDELTERRLRARAGFEPLPDRSAIERELKGVTYHDLAVMQRGDGWYARVVFDV